MLSNSSLPLGGADGVAVEEGSQRVAGCRVVLDGFAVGVQEFTPLTTPLVGHPHTRSIAGQIDQRDGRGSHFVHCRHRSWRACRRGSSPKAPRAGPGRAAGCRARSCWNRRPARRDPAPRTPCRPSEQGLEAEVFAAANFAGVVQGLAHEHRRGGSVRIAVQGDNFFLEKAAPGPSRSRPQGLPWEVSRVGRFLSWFFSWCPVKSKGKRRG
jgi:hypothetical protein